MKVKDLMADLSAMDPEAEVKMQTFEGCHGPGDTYEISSTDFWEADPKYKIPSTALIEVGDGCFCDGNRGSKVKFLGLGPQNISQFYLGLQEAFDVVAKSLEWYNKELTRIGKPKDYEEKTAVDRYGQAKRALENTLRDIGKLQNRGEKS